MRDMCSLFRLTVVMKKSSAMKRLSSTEITRAPWSARIIEQKGPGSKRDKSSTVIPDKEPFFKMFLPIFSVKFNYT